MKTRISIFVFSLIIAASLAAPVTVSAAETETGTAVVSEAAVTAENPEASEETAADESEGAADGISNTDASDEVAADTEEDPDYKEPDDIILEEDEDDEQEEASIASEASDKADTASEQEEDSKEEQKSDDDKKSEDKNEKKSDKKSAKKTSAKAKKPKYSAAEVKLLACLIYTEAGNQSYRGKLAVGNVVMNRVKSSRFPNTIKGVIYQPHQFGVCGNSRLAKALESYDDHWGVDKSIFNSCVKAAKEAMAGKSATEDTYYFFCGYSSSLAARRDGVKIGAHYIYK